LICHLTISSSAGGSVITPGEGVFPYEKGTAVDLVASAAGAYRFINWTGDVDTVANVNADSTTITMDGDYSITANFALEAAVRRLLTITSTEGGSVVRPGEGSFAYDEGTVVTLAASTEEGYRFVRWTGDVSTIADVYAAETAVTMNSDKNVAANFEMWSPCQAHFTADRIGVEVGETVTFTNQTTGGDPPYLAAAWDFDGDGTVDSTAAVQPGETVAWAYDEPGLYTVSLTITGTHATCMETRHDYITVYTEVLPDEPDLPAALESIADQLVIVLLWQPATQSWDMYFPLTGDDSIGTLEVNRAYFIYVDAACTLEYGTRTIELYAGWNNPAWPAQ